MELVVLVRITKDRRGQSLLNFLILRNKKLYKELISNIYI